MNYNALVHLKTIAAFLLLILICSNGGSDSGGIRKPESVRPARDQRSEARLAPDRAIEGRKSDAAQVEQVLSSLPPVSLRYQQCATALRLLHEDVGSEILVKHLTASPGLSGGATPLDAYPCALALSQLGSVAYPAIFRKLDGKCTEQELRILANVVCHIDGRELAQYRLQIESRPAVSLTDPRGRSIERRSEAFRANTSRLIEWLRDPQFPRRAI